MSAIEECMKKELVEYNGNISVIKNNSIICEKMNVEIKKMEEFLKKAKQDYHKKKTLLDKQKKQVLVELGCDTVPAQKKKPMPKKKSVPEKKVQKRSEMLAPIPELPRKKIMVTHITSWEEAKSIPIYCLNKKTIGVKIAGKVFQVCGIGDFTDGKQNCVKCYKPNHGDFCSNYWHEGTIRDFSEWTGFNIGSRSIPFGKINAIESNIKLATDDDIELFKQFIVNLVIRGVIAATHCKRF